MRIVVTKRGHIKFYQIGKFQFRNHVTMGDIWIGLLLASWFAFDILVWWLR